MRCAGSCDSYPCVTQRENKSKVEEIDELCYSIGSCIVAKYMKAKGKNYVAILLISTNRFFRTVQWFFQSPSGR